MFYFYLKLKNKNKILFKIYPKIKIIDVRHTQFMSTLSPSLNYVPNFQVNFSEHLRPYNDTTQIFKILSVYKPQQLQLHNPQGFNYIVGQLHQKLHRTISFKCQLPIDVLSKQSHIYHRWLVSKTVITSVRALNPSISCSQPILSRKANKIHLYFVTQFYRHRCALKLKLTVQN